MKAEMKAKVKSQEKSSDGKRAMQRNELRLEVDVTKVPSDCTRYKSSPSPGPQR